jgi:hypothetical protein
MPARLLYHLANRRTATLLRNATAAAVRRAAVLRKRSSIRSLAARSSAVLSFARSRLPYCNSVLVRVCWPSFTLLISLQFAFSPALRWPKLSHSTHPLDGSHYFDSFSIDNSTTRQRPKLNETDTNSGHVQLYFSLFRHDELFIPKARITTEHSHRRHASSFYSPPGPSGAGRQTRDRVAHER